MAISGASLRFSGGITSLDSLHCGGISGAELHVEAPYCRFDAEVVYCPDPGQVRRRRKSEGEWKCGYVDRSVDTS